MVQKPCHTINRFIKQLLERPTKSTKALSNVCAYVSPEMFIGAWRTQTKFPIPHGDTQGIRQTLSPSPLIDRLASLPRDGDKLLGLGGAEG